jgi:hypothetical protein
MFDWAAKSMVPVSLWEPVGGSYGVVAGWGQPRIGPEATERSLWVPTGRPTFRGLEFQRVGSPERVKVSAETPSGFFAPSHIRRSVGGPHPSSLSASGSRCGDSDESVASWPDALRSRTDHPAIAQ